MGEGSGSVTIITVPDLLTTKCYGSGTSPLVILDTTVVDSVILNIAVIYAVILDADVIDAVILDGALVDSVILNIAVMNSHWLLLYKADMTLVDY